MAIICFINLKERAMKKIIVLLGAFLTMTVFNSCSKQDNSVIQTEQSKKIEQTKKTEKSNIPEGWADGQVKEYQGKDKKEQNVLRQTKSYYSAILTGDIENASHYVFEDCISYDQKHYFQELSNDEVLYNFLKEASTEAIKLQEIFKKRGLYAEIINVSIGPKVDSNEYLLYVINAVAQVSLNKSDGTEAYIHSADTDASLAISFDNGKTWKFMAINEDTPNILRMRFSEDIINKIMGY